MRASAASVRTRRATRNIVVISDTHCGCRLGLCPKDGVKLDDGGLYLPSSAQLALWAWWEEFWGEWVPMATHGEGYDVVMNGDCVDGVHHNSTTQVSHNLGDQKKIAIGCFEPVLNGQMRDLYWIRGTEAHVAKSAREEEEIAEHFGAKANSEGQHARWELWKRAGRDHLVHFLHHIGTTASSAHESSAVNAELTATMVEAARWGERPPSIVVRSHRHRSIEVRLPVGNGGYATGVVTPAWQLKTPFTYKIAGARLAPPQIGGVLIRVSDRDEIYTQTFVRHVGRPKVE
jgi:hypothetical protein